MCTLIVAHKVYRDYPIVVAANRDEQLDRPSDVPALRDKKFGIFCPKDLLRGGTWIGVNKFGLFAALTNRIDVQPKSKMAGVRSRGDLVLKALSARTAISATTRLAVINPKMLCGFNLVIADAQFMFLLRGDSETISVTERSDVLVVTNRGVGDCFDSSTPKRVRNILSVSEKERVFKDLPTPAKLEKLLHIHDGVHGTCILQPKETYGTKSSSIIMLNNGWHYWHRERTAIDNHICSDKFADENIIQLW